MQNSPELQIVQGGDSRNKQTRMALYIIGGVVVFGCCAVMIVSALLMPSFMKSKDAAKGAATLNNMRVIGIGLSMYVADNDNRLPPASTWMDSIGTHVPDSSVIRAPSGDQLDFQYGYVFNSALDQRVFSELSDIDRTPLIFEGDAPLRNTNGGAELLASRNGNAYILLASLSARRMMKEQAANLNWQAR